MGVRTFEICTVLQTTAPLDAYHIISQMGGKPVPKEWQGGLNVTYNFGPGMKDNKKLEIEVHSSIEKRCVFIVFYLNNNTSERFKT